VPQFKYVASGSYVIASDGTGVGPVGYQVSVTSRGWSGSVVFAQNIAPPGSVPNYVNVAYQDANTGTEFAAGTAITGTAAVIISPTVGDLIAIVTVTTGEVIINVNPATQGVTNRELRNAFTAAGYDTAGQDTTEAMLSVAVAGMLGQVLDVRAFGAKGDGVTDDTAAIQRAVTAMTAGDSLLIPAGFTFLVTANITKSSVDDLCFVAEGATIYTTDMSLTGVFTFTACDRLTWRGGYFLGTEDNTYFQANTPSAERSFIYLNACLRASVSGIRGKHKRRLLTALDSHYLSITDYKMEGFFQDVSAGAVANGNHAPTVAIRHCDFTTASHGTANNCGSVLLGQLSSENVSVSVMTGYNLHDNCVYTSSGLGWTISDVSATWVVGNVVQTRGSKMSVTNVSGTNIPTDYAVDMSSVNTADGYGATCSNVTSDNCLGALAIEPNATYRLFDVAVSNIAAYNSTGTGLGDSPVEVIAAGNVAISNVVVRTTGSDIGILVGGVDAGNPCNGIVVSNCSVRDVNGSSANTRGGIRVQFATDYAVTGCTFDDIDAGIGVRILTCDGGVVSGNAYPGGQVVRIPTAETNVNGYITGNHGATINADGDNNVIGDNDAVVTGYPATSTTPRRIGQLTFSGGEAFIATGTSSSADWQQMTP
jgi:hypothetical protein